mgnify:FL=1
MQHQIRYTKTLGNSAIYFRLRGKGTDAGKFWNFVILAWETPQVDNCRIFATEYADSDPYDSVYMADVIIPAGGPYIIEAVLESNSEVLGSDTTAIDDSMSSRASQASLDKEGIRLFSLIESQRGAHTGFGNIYYWDPVNGNDANDGLTRQTAKLTFAAVNTLVVAYNHDIIIRLRGLSTDPIDLNKAYTFLRGPGRDAKIKPTTSNNDTATLSAEGCELSGLIIETHTSGSKDAIKILADFAKLSSVWVDYSRGHGLAIENASHALIDRLVVQDAAAGGSGHGVSIKSTTGTARRNFLKNLKILNNAGDGIRLDGANVINNFVVAGEFGSSIDSNTGHGVNELNGGDHNHVVGPGLLVHKNTAGDINLTGANSVALNLEQWAKASTPMVNVVSAVNGAIDVDTVKDGGVITIYRKTKVAITFNLGKNMTGRKLYFAVRKDVADTAYTIPIGGTTPKEITATTDLATGSGYIDLSTTETNIAATLYSYAEVQSVSNAGGDPVPEQIFQLRVKDHALNL